MNIFDREAVEAGIVNTQFAGRVAHFASVSSTNLTAMEAAQAGARVGVWVADEQTAGRGRGGHGWHSSVGEGLYASVLITPALPITTALWISLATGLATKAAIREVTALDADIRWPNDLLIHSRKCGGILVETAVSPAEAERPAMLRYAVIGIGINISQTGFPAEIVSLATSLKLECNSTGNNIRREALLVALLRQLDLEIEQLVRDWHETYSGQRLFERFAAGSSWVKGKRVSVDECGGFTGVTAGLDERGFLLVDADDGARRTVLSGGVREL
ncbi:MAG: biotin--[acetyl-CoA-carboxylase] ligase [Acidobacteriaceae bacterium]|nr:biotin--[acetyl-CoA-carboxylase] ligase [Acidobacteriaceae bacterium]